MTKTQPDFEEFARTVIDAVEAVDLEYLIGGSVALNAWGEPRTTRDLDVVINLPLERIYPLSQELHKREMYVPFDIIVDLLMQPGDLPINAIHGSSGYKAEFFLLRDQDDYRRVSLTRRRLVRIGRSLGEVYVHSPEDLIINKVYYFGLSQQTKHVRDIAGIIAFCGDELDTAYIDEWVVKLGIEAVWQEIQTQVARLLGNVMSDAGP